MKYEVNFGSLPSAPATGSPSETFRIAILGDLSGRANLGKLETGAALATRRPHRVDIDNLDEILARLNIQLHLPIADDGGSVSVPLAEMDDFHPDQLHEQLEIFSKLSSLRKKLADPGTFDRAAQAVQTMLGSAAVERHSHRRQPSRGSVVPNAKLSDFSVLMGQPTASEKQTPVVELLKQLVRPHVAAEPDPRQDQMVATVDEALADTMRRVLSEPDFQALESVWRSIELLVRQLETDTSLQIVLYDITAEEIAADLSSTDQLEETGLYKLLVEQPRLDAQQGALSVLVGNYTFEKTPPHADLLGRLAKVASTADAPFIAAISNDVLKKVKPEDEHPLVKQSWAQLRALPEASYLALTAPRFMLRWPYGKKSDPIDSFDFEEFTDQNGVSGMLWGNGTFLAGLVLGLTFRQGGMKAMKLGSVLGVGDMPYYYYTDKHGDQIALPCTDRLLSERLAAHVSSQNLIPLLSIKGRPEVRLGSLSSLFGSLLHGPWSSDSLPSAAPTTATSSSPPEREMPTETPVSTDTSEAPATTTAADDTDLDALLAGLDEGTNDPGSPQTEEAPAASAFTEDTEDTEDADLDALLASFDDDSGNDDDAAMDAELEALLGDL